MLDLVELREAHGLEVVVDPPPLVEDDALEGLNVVTGELDALRRDNAVRDLASGGKLLGGARLMPPAYGDSLGFVRLADSAYAGSGACVLPLWRFAADVAAAAGSEGPAVTVIVGADGGATDERRGAFDSAEEPARCGGVFRRYSTEELPTQEPSTCVRGADRQGCRWCLRSWRRFALRLWCLIFVLRRQGCLQQRDDGVVSHAVRGGEGFRGASDLLEASPKARKASASREALAEEEFCFSRSFGGDGKVTS